VVKGLCLRFRGVSKKSQLAKLLGFGMEAQNSFPAIRLNNVAKELSGKRLLYPQENTFSTPVILLESYLTKGFRD